MLAIPHALLMLFALLVLASILFIWLNRPIYEVMWWLFIAIVALSWQWDSFFAYILFPAQSSLFFIIFAFLFVAVIFEKTKAIEDIIAILLSLVGSIRGGAGYVATIASAFMGSLSGTGPGNVAATGVFTIPMMKRTGFSKELAATVEMSSSMLGNIIPPSGIVILSYGVLETATHTIGISLNKWMLISYLIGGYFLLQRLITLFVICKVTGVQPIPKDQIPDWKVVLKERWPTLLLPLVIFVPLIFDMLAAPWLISRIGPDGQKLFSSSVLIFTPAFAGAYALAVTNRRLRTNEKKAQRIYVIARESLTTVAPIAITIYLAYALAQVFIGMHADEEIRQWFVNLEMSRWALVIILPLFFAVLGMVLPGSAQIAILGAAMVSAFAALGGDPILLAILLPAMTGAMEGMTPPMALGLYVAMGIAGSEFKPTAKLAFIWIGTHLALTIILLYGLLPLPGV